MNRTLPVLCLIATAAVAGCSDEPVQPAPPATASPATWQYFTIPGTRSPHFVDLQVGDNDMLALAPRFFALINPDGEILNQWYTLLDFATDQRSMPFIARDYFVYAIWPAYNGAIHPNKSISINWRAAPGEVPTEAQLHVSVLDPTLADDAVYPPSNGPVAVIDDDGLMLLRVSEAPSSATYIYFVQLSPYAPGNFSVINVDVKGRIDSPPGTQLLTVGGRFFLSSVQETNEIHPDGSVAKLFDHGAVDFITFDGKLVASTRDGLFTSSDDGTTWDRASYFGTGDLFEVEGRLCLLSTSGIAEVTLDDAPNAQMVSLAWAGLPNTGHAWRAAVQHGDRVYVATYDGLYYKSVKDFFTPLDSE